MEQRAPKEDRFVMTFFSLLLNTCASLGPTLSLGTDRLLILEVETKRFSTSLRDRDSCHENRESQPRKLLEDQNQFQ